MGNVLWPGVTFRLAAGKPAQGFEAFGCDLVGGLSVEHALSSVVVGGIGAPQQLFKLPVRVDCDPHVSGGGDPRLNGDGG